VKKCKCGCGVIIKDKRSIYLRGHNLRVYNPMKGKHHTEVNRAKMSKSLKEKRADPLSAYNTEKYHQSNCERLRKAWANPNSGFNSPDFTKKVSEGVVKRFNSEPLIMKRVSNKIRKLWNDPNSSYNQPSFRESLKKAWNNPNSIYNLPEYRKEVSRKTSEQWADPNSAFNKPGFREKLGFGKKSLSSDGHFCQSIHELTFEEWLIKNKIKHTPHPPIPNKPSKRADQLVSIFYIEIDGMNRSKKYWKDRYNGTYVNPLIILSKECSEEGLQKYLKILKEKYN
jgi:hypothetical protein